GRDRVPPRPARPPCRGHSAPRRELQAQSRPPLSGQAAARHSGARARRRPTRSDAGRRVRRSDDHLNPTPIAETLMQRTILFFILLCFASGAAMAQEKYQRKSGLWEVKRVASRTEDQERVYQECIDQASDNALRQLAGGMRSERCETSKAVREGDKLVVEATCTVAKTSKATTHAVITGKFDTAYKIESKSTFDPPLKGKTEGTAVFEAK